MEKKQKHNLNYNHKLIEDKIKNIWIKQSEIQTEFNDNESYFKVLMPPPNVTGKLHLGHALNNFLQDALIRTKRLQGYQTIWVPGFDHAGIATEILVRKWIAKNKFPINENKNLKWYFQKWVKQQMDAIRDQWMHLGLNINEELLAFTLDTDFQQGVKKAFIKLYNQNLIYQNHTLVNMDTLLQTAIADIEVNHKTQKGKLYYIKYWNQKRSNYLEVATTRPETIFVDQALIVHPEDKRFIKYHNNKFFNPLTNKLIPILTSKIVDQEFGSGILKCTPGHDFNDFEIGKQYNLTVESCFEKNGILTKKAGKFIGLDRLKARPEIVKYLQEKKLIIKIEDIKQKIPYSSRTDQIVEPLLSKQWFLKTKNWAKTMIKKSDKLNFIPKKYHQQFLNWMRDCKDWCISRQLTWGHTLPIYFKNNQIKVFETAPEDSSWIQSTDVLDTWFSSGLWSLINFGWENPKKQKYEKLLPLDYLVTSYDIIFFWVAKMLFFHDHFKNEIPFKNILIHGLIRTTDNQKMSKSKGNVIDPLNIIEEYGADSLRFYLLANHKIGNDLKFQKTKLIQAKQLCNKLLNIHHFVIKQGINNNFNPYQQEIKSSFNQFFLNKFNKLLKTINIKFIEHQWSVGLQTITNFVWKDFSNFYLETNKLKLKNSQHKDEYQKVMMWLWKQILIILHPYLPFLTEYLWTQDISKQTILNANYPKPKKTLIISQQILFDLIFNTIFPIIEDIDKNLINQKSLQFLMTINHEKLNQIKLKELNQMLKPYKVEIINIFPMNIKNESLQMIEFSNDVIKQKEILIKIKKEILRSEGILKNKAFITNAKLEVVEKEKQKLKNWEIKNKIFQMQLKIIKQNI